MLMEHSFYTFIYFIFHFFILFLIFNKLKKGTLDFQCEFSTVAFVWRMSPNEFYAVARRVVCTYTSRPSPRFYI